MNKKYTQFSFVFVIISIFVNCTSTLLAENDLKFNHLTVVDGLLHSNATCVAQDSSGFVWIGTQRGLSRYDGYKIDSYLKKSDIFSSVFNNRIRKIVVDGDLFWIATQQGLQCFDNRQKVYIDYSDLDKVGFANLQIIHNLFIDSKQRIWIGLQGKMFCASISKEKNKILLKNIKINNQTYLQRQDNITPEVAELANGTLLLLSSGKLFEMNPTNSGQFKTTAINTTFSDIKKIKTIGNDLWLFFIDKAVAVHYVNNQLQQFDEITYPACYIVGVESSADYIWLSTNQGLQSIAKKRVSNRIQSHLHSVLDVYSVSSDHQSSIFIDNKNNLWVSTWGAGVSYTNIGKQKFELVKYMPIKSNKYLPSEFVYSIHEDNKGHIYVGTKFGGISRYNLQTKTFDYTINLEEKLGIKALVPCIESDENWIYALVTFQGSSVYRIHKLNQKIELVKSYFPNTAFSLGFDKHKQLWVGVLGRGLSCLKIENGRVINEKLFTSQSDPVLNLSSNDVNYVFNDHKKNEVLVSTTNGLNRLMLNEKGDVSAIAYYLADEKNPKTLSSNYLWPIDKENDSTYWIGTLGSGLNRIIIGKRVEGAANYSAENFGENNGAPSNDIESVLVDKFGNVWCGGRYLSSFNYKTKKFKTYYEEDGLQSYLFGTGTACKTRNGMLFFGGSKGMNYFMPDNKEERQQYEVIFSRIIIDGKPLRVNDTLNGSIVLKSDLQFLSKIKIPYPCNSLTIEFSSLTYAQKKNIQYRYKLDGFDKDWIYTNGLSPYAIYPKLQYKKYKFIVEVGYNNEWGKSSNELVVDILPPWWQSILAYLIYAFLIIGIFIVAARYSFNWINLKRQMSLQNEREKQKEELMELKMNLFTNISHEFKTPLTLINATVVEIEANNEQPLGSRNFKILKRNNSKLLHLIRELMDFQRSNASLIELKTTQIDVCKFMQEIVEEFMPLSELSEIELKLNIPAEPLLAWVDEECLTKIVSNIISNSLRYTEKGGVVVVTLSVGQLNSYKSKFESSISFTDDMETGDQLIFSVSDTGIGISSESLPDVFERFHTVVSRTSKHLGSGVGLALVKSLVKIHRGGVIMSSQRNVGTDFVFSIPLSSDYLSENQKIVDSEFNRQLYLVDYKEHLQEEEITFLNANDVSKPTILFVDDNKDILTVLSDHFSLNFNILMAFDGEEALKLCNEKYPDIVVSDVMMPKMNGLELCAKIKSQLNTCLIPVILLTARGTTEQQIEGLEDGADAYIPKPFHFGLLSSTINNLLKRAKLANKISATTQPDNILVSRDTLLDDEKQQFIDKLNEIIKNNYHKPEFSIDDFCLEIGISRSRLYVQMKSITTETIGSIIREYRLQKAAELLRTTKISVSEVSYQVGIDSPSFFSRSFKERFGVSPSEYIKNINS